MGKAWKQVGLGLLNLTAVVLTVVGIQAVLHKFHASQSAGAIVTALLVLCVYLAGSKWIERRPPSELAPARALPEAVSGLVLGLILFSAVMGILWMVRTYSPAWHGATKQILPGFASAVVAGILEEILFRGLLFRLSAKILGTWGALLFTAAFFGAAHAFNPGATVSSSLAIALEAGVLLGAAYAATSRLWLPIGLHIGWNFTEGALFGMSVSGGKMSGGMLQGSLQGPRVLTGGQFGPEASIVAVLVCLAAAMYFIYRIIKLHHVQAPIWSRAERAE
jgi:CAAX protease family protein